MTDSGDELSRWTANFPSHWTVLRLKNVANYVTSGSRGWAHHYSNDGDLFIRIGNLTRDSIDLDLSDIQYVKVPDDSEGKRTRLRSGDLVISITAYLGSVAVVPEDAADSYVSQHVALVRPIAKLASSRFIAYIILSEFGQTQLAISGYRWYKDTIES